MCVICAISFIQLTDLKEELLTNNFSIKTDNQVFIKIDYI